MNAAALSVMFNISIAKMLRRWQATLASGNLRKSHREEVKTGSKRHRTGATGTLHPQAT
jgi:hypothetical protein